MLIVERNNPGFLDQPEVVSYQIGHKDMEVRVFESSARKHGEVFPRYEFWLPRLAGVACTTTTDPTGISEVRAHTSPAYCGA